MDFFARDEDAIAVASQCDPVIAKLDMIPLSDREGLVEIELISSDIDPYGTIATDDISQLSCADRAIAQQIFGAETL